MTIVPAFGTSWRSSSNRLPPTVPLMKACNVATRPVETRYEAVPNRIAAGGEHDRYYRGRRFCPDRRQSVADNHRGSACDYFGG